MVRMKVSVLFATYNRDDILRKSLAGYNNLNLDGIDLELIIVDNYVSNATRFLIEQQSLPIRYVECQTPGKNAALNKGLKFVSGDYVVFTDDDAVPDKNWIVNYAMGFKQYSDTVIFGGPILPIADHWPMWIDLSDKCLKSAYVIRTLSKKDCEVKPTEVWGPNMAIKRSVFDAGLKFNEHIGPSGTDYIMGSETELLRRLEKLGYSAKYLASVEVGHQIREEQLTLSWLKNRAFRAGKGMAHYKTYNKIYSEDLTYLFKVPRFLLVGYFRECIRLLLIKPFISRKKYTSLIYQNRMKKGEISFLRNQTQ